MGSLCNSNPTTTSTYAPSAQGQQLYGQVINSAEQAASTPYQAYTGELVAPLSGTQNAGISNINAASGIASPYINQAASYATQGSSPITGAQISNYSNPYQQDVINSTLANINETNAQQSQQLKGNAISSGAFGGDRAGIAQAELARQQGLASNQTIAGLNAQNYNQALGAAQADRAAAGQGAYTFGNLGSLAQNTALTGAGAQLQAGGLQQGTQQAQDTAQYQQFLQKLAFPYQQTQFLAGVGIPAASGFGGTQTTTPPSPNPFSQIAGLGLTAASFLKRGGRIDNHYANGGSSPYSIPDFGVGWIPSVQIQAPQQHQFGNTGSGSAQSGGDALTAGLKTFGGAGGFHKIGGLVGGAGSPIDLGSNYAPSPLGSFDAGTAGGTGLGGFGGLYARGGLVDAVHHIRSALRGRRYADGGDVLPFADRAAPVEDAIAASIFDPQGADYTRFAPDDRRAMTASAAPVAGPADMNAAPTPLAASAATLPPEILTGQSAPISPDDAGPLAYDQASPLAGPAGGQSAPVAAPSGDGGLLAHLGLGNGLGLSDDTRSSLLAAGLGIMSGTSPYGLANIGQGGLKGLAQAQELRKEKMTKDQLAQHAQLEGQKLAQQLLMHREMTPYQSAEVESRQAQQAQTAKYQGAVLDEQRRQHDLALKTPVNLGADPRTGMPIMALPRPNPNGGIDYFMIGPGGQISDRPIGSPAAPGAAPPLSPGPAGPQSGLPSSPANAAQSPVRTAALETGTATDAPRPGEGTVQYNTRIAQNGAYDYGSDAPYIERGMDVPEPSPLAGRSVQSLKTDSESYLLTGKLPPVVRGNSPVALVQQRYQNAVKNYGNALAQARGMDPAEVANTWRTAPGMLRFILGADGRATVSLGTAVRHLDTMQQLTDAWQKGSTIGDWRTWDKVSSAARREFGDASVTNLESAAKIIGPEVLKAIGVAGAGGQGEREAIEKIFAPGSTPDQIKGAIGTVQTLLGGQLEGKQRQAENAGVTKDRFKNLIGDRPYELLTHGGAPAGGAAAAPTNLPTVKSKAEYDALKSGATFLDQGGKQWSKP